MTVNILVHVDLPEHVCLHLQSILPYWFREAPVGLHSASFGKARRVSSHVRQSRELKHLKPDRTLFMQVENETFPLKLTMK